MKSTFVERRHALYMMQSSCAFSIICHYRYSEGGTLGHVPPLGVWFALWMLLDIVKLYFYCKVSIKGIYVCIYQFDLKCLLTFPNVYISVIYNVSTHYDDCFDPMQ